MNENHDLFSIKSKKVVGIFKKETPEKVWIDAFVALRSKCYAVICGIDSENKLKGISKSFSKSIKFDEYKKSLDGEEYQQECDNYSIRSLNHEMYLQLVQKSTLSIFDIKRCYIYMKLKVYHGVSVIKWL